VRGVVPLEQLVHHLIGELQAREPQRNVEVRVGNLGQCEGNAPLLEQALTNLLSNAFKFTRGQEPAIVEINSQNEEQGTVYFVRDNGAGFDMKYADKLFGVFQRLHSELEFEGSGVGLSIVRRIIERHGGRIWADSVLGKGATFFFTIPSIG
jgi:light-regulated signal transduction histidine kinase (bacteriophytochrome)